MIFRHKATRLYEKGLAATIKTLEDEIKALESNKPALVIPAPAKELN